uniref:Uncharacterized protein n=1 Tax=Rhizophora mucronata TaxID=61149 RepID=A0A2P2PD36_RHIMU
MPGSSFNTWQVDFCWVRFWRREKFNHF